MNASTAILSHRAHRGNNALALCFKAAEYRWETYGSVYGRIKFAVPYDRRHRRGAHVTEIVVEFDPDTQRVLKTTGTGRRSGGEAYEVVVESKADIDGGPGHTALMWLIPK